MTADGGYYLFPYLAPGDYYSVFYQTGDYQTTLLDQGADDALDSDGIPVISNDTLVAVMPITTLTTLELDYNWDLGLRGPSTAASLGNYVWHDANLDGLQNEPDSAGMNGVVVNIYENSAPTVIYSTTTTSNDLAGNPGYYSFQNLPAGNYFLEVVLPTDYGFTNQGATGTSDIGDSDFDKNNSRTEVFSLVLGNYDASWDAGLALENCSNGLDDDGDGLVDCDDSDCVCCEAQAPILSK